MAEQKTAVRAWLNKRAQQTPRTPPNPEDIRRELGWTLIQQQRKTQHGR